MIGVHIGELCVMGSAMIGAIVGWILWPWWSVPALVLPLYGMAAAKSCGWRAEIGLGCDVAAEAIAATIQVSIGLAAWWLAASLKRRRAVASRQPPRP